MGRPVKGVLGAGWHIKGRISPRLGHPILSMKGRFLKGGLGSLKLNIDGRLLEGQLCAGTLQPADHLTIDIDGRLINGRLVKGRYIT